MALKLRPLGFGRLRGFIANGAQRHFTSAASNENNGVPKNMEGLDQSDKSSIMHDRSREISGQQMTSMFSGSFLSGQALDAMDNQPTMEDTSGFIVDRTTNLQSVVQTNLPEPFAAFDAANLKEGLPAGLSDTMIDGPPQRWTMTNRLDYAREPREF